MNPPATRLFYVDDSGADKTGWAVYSWVECVISNWRAGLRDWLNLRRALYRDHGIPADYELHATKFVGGRGNPSLDPGWNRKKHLRSVVAEQALSVLSESHNVQVGTVYRAGTGQSRGHDHAHDVALLYAAMVHHLDDRLAAAGELGIIVVDGDGTDHSYYVPHRDLKLDHRHIIEDPFFQQAHRSQWLQMADLVAYTAYQGLLRHPGKEFAWDWYDTYLRGCDVNDGPIQLLPAENEARPGPSRT